MKESTRKWLENRNKKGLTMEMIQLLEGKQKTSHLQNPKPSKNRKKASNNATTKKWIKATRKRLIANETESEKEFYSVLKLLDIPFTKQRPFVIDDKIFFADAVFEKTKTIVEIDGGYHNTKKQQAKDKRRTKMFNKIGYKVVRIPDEDVYDRFKFMDELYQYLPVKLDAYKIL